MTDVLFPEGERRSPWWVKIPEQWGARELKEPKLLRIEAADHPGFLWMFYEHGGRTWRAASVANGKWPPFYQAIIDKAKSDG